jgi:hypothetical protein
MAFLAIDSGRSASQCGDISAATRRESRATRHSARSVKRGQLPLRNGGARLLLDLDDARARSHKAELEQVARQDRSNSRAYASKGPESEKAGLKQLDDSIDSYWKSLAPSLQWSASTRRKRGEEFLRDVVIPRRAEIVELAKQVTALNERDLDLGEESLEASASALPPAGDHYLDHRLDSGGNLAGIIIRRVQRLEKEAEARYREAEERAANWASFQTAW